jgi:hypothetical protein
MVGTSKDGGIALIVPTDFHATVPTSVQKSMDDLLAVTRQDDGLLTHGGHEVISRFGELALVADKEPGTGEDLLLLLLVDVLVDEDLTADTTAVQIDQLLHGTGRCGVHHGHSPLRSIGGIITER